MEIKELWKSKTFWFAVLYGVVNLAGLFGYSTYQADATVVEIVTVLIAVVTIILRYVTTQPVK